MQLLSQSLRSVLVKIVGDNSKLRLVKVYLFSQQSFGVGKIHAGIGGMVLQPKPFRGNDLLNQVKLHSLCFSDFLAWPLAAA